MEALVEEQIDLVFVLTEQLMPLLEDWKETVRGALDSPDPAQEEAGPQHLSSPWA